MQVGSSYQGFWLWIRLHLSSQVLVEHARAFGPSSWQEGWFAQHVPVAAGAQAATSATSRLHFMTPGHGVAPLHAIIIWHG